MGRRTVLELEDRDDLDRAVVLVSWLNRPSMEKVRVTLPWLDPSEQARSAAAIHRLFNDCGCLWGGPTFFLVLVGSLTTRFVAAEMSWAAMGVSFLVAMLAAFAAKILGLAVTRWRLLVWLRRLSPPNEPAAERGFSRMA
jgi:hypothetical protein